VKTYTSKQHKKFVILYGLFTEKFKEQQDKKLSFSDFIQRFLEKSDVDHRVQVGLESGFKFSLSLLKEVRSLNQDMLINSLEYLYQTLRWADPRSLYSTDKVSLMIDQNINDARNFMVDICEDKKTPPRGVELAYKIILLMGNIRANVEDFLIVATLLDKHNPNVDLREELLLIKEDSTVSQDLSKINFSSRQKTKEGDIFYLQTGSYEKQIDMESSATTDGEFIYLHQKELGLLKIGTGQKNQMLGKVYLHKPDFKSDKHCSLLSFKGKLLVRCEDYKPKPFAIIDPDTLEETKEEVELEKEDQSLEWKEDKEKGRTLHTSPLFTDGRYVYVVAQVREPKAQGGKHL